jgi:hypothetical protein
MERLRQVVRGVGLFIWYCAFCLCAMSAENVCSLTVKVLSPNGRALYAPVSVQEQNGRVEDKDQEDGSVQFCDLGILPVTVTVGNIGMCNQVTVQNVPVTWRQPYLLTVTYDPEACGRREVVPPPVPICEMLFRVADAAGNWVSGAALTLAAPTRDLLKTDQYGRAHFYAEVNDNLRGHSIIQSSVAILLGQKLRPT